MFASDDEKCEKFQRSSKCSEYLFVKHFKPFVMWIRWARLSPRWSGRECSTANRTGYDKWTSPVRVAFHAHSFHWMKVDCYHVVAIAWSEWERLVGKTLLGFGYGHVKHWYQMIRNIFCIAMGISRFPIGRYSSGHTHPFRLRGRLSQLPSINVLPWRNLLQLLVMVNTPFRMFLTKLPSEANETFLMGRDAFRS